MDHNFAAMFGKLYRGIITRARARHCVIKMKRVRKYLLHNDNTDQNHFSSIVDLE